MNPTIGQRIFVRRYVISSVYTAEYQGFAPVLGHVAITDDGLVVAFKEWRTRETEWEAVI